MANTAVVGSSALGLRTSGGGWDWRGNHSRGLVARSFRVDYADGALAEKCAANGLTKTPFVPFDAVGIEAATPIPTEYK